jgi:hypothetical protein
MNRIIIHTYNFLKLYILSFYRDDKSLPIINEKLIVLIIKTIFKADNRGRKFSDDSEELMLRLKQFHVKHYLPLMVDDKDLSYTNLSQMIEYESVTIITALKNHIQEHFEDFVNRIVNLYHKKNEFIEKYKEDRKKVNQFIDELKDLKEDLMTGKNNAKPKYTRFKEIFNLEVINGFNVDGSFREMIKDDPMSLMIYMLNMSVYSEKLGKEQLKEKDDRQIKIINVFPLRDNIIPKYVSFDTHLLKHALITENNTYYNSLSISDWKIIWAECFKIDKKVFRKNGYMFYREISTDGVGCSILFIKSEYYKNDKSMKSKNMPKPKCYKEEKYVDDLTDDDKKRMLKKKLVGIDPGKIDLIYATDGNTQNIIKGNPNKIFRNTTYFRYSNKQRIHETKSNIYKRKLLKFKKMKFIKVKNKNKSIEELETELSKHNSNVCDFNRFKEYLKLKLIINSLLINNYQKEIYRKYKWYGFINEQKSEQKMINNFKDLFGEPDKVCIMIGDWDERGKAVRGQPPTKGIGIRRLFRKAGYKDLYLVNEYNTSCKLNKTGESLVCCRKTRTPLALKMLTDKKVEIKSKFKSAEIISRDLNGSLNIWLKGKCILERKEIPLYMNPKERYKISNP